MAVTFVGSSAGNYTVPRPGGADTGDVLIVIYPSTSGSGISTPSGFADLWSGTWRGGANSLLMWYRVITDIASEATSYTIGSAAATFVHCFRGVDTAAPFAVIGEMTASASSTSLSIGSATTTADEALLTMITARFSGSGAMSVGMDVAGVSDFGPRASEVLTEVWPTAGPAGSRTVTWPTSSASFAYLTALRPAGGGPPPVTAKPWSYAQVIE